MVNRLRVCCALTFVFAGLSVLVGLSYGVAVPHTAAEALEDAIRGAQTPDEVRARIVDYYSSTVVSRLIVFVTPGLAAAITAAIALWEIARLRDPATNVLPTDRHKSAEPPLP